MSYDLLFWKQEAGLTLDPADVLSSIAEDKPIVGLAGLPIREWTEAVLKAFPDAREEPNGSREWITWTSRDEAKSFQMEWSPVHVWVTCRPLNIDIANRFIDIASEFGCLLYDPQTGERFGA